MYEHYLKTKALLWKLHGAPVVYIVFTHRILLVKCRRHVADLINHLETKACAISRQHSQTGEWRRELDEWPSFERVTEPNLETAQNEHKNVAGH